MFKWVFNFHSSYFNFTVSSKHQAIPWHFILAVSLQVLVIGLDVLLHITPIVHIKNNPSLDVCFTASLDLVF